MQNLKKTLTYFFLIRDETLGDNTHFNNWLKETHKETYLRAGEEIIIFPDSTEVLTIKDKTNLHKKTVLIQSQTSILTLCIF